MFGLLARVLRSLLSVLAARGSREAEILVLRQQLLVLSRKAPKRARLRNIDRLILVWLSRLFPSVLDAIVIVKPETVLRWHRRGFRAYWRWKSWRPGGRPRIARELRELIRRMSRENPLWGAPRIHGELLMLGIDVSESTVGRYMVRTRRPRSQGWDTFLRNQAAGIASIDLFVVRLHAGDTTAGRNKSPDFSTLSEFLVGTALDSTWTVQQQLVSSSITAVIAMPAML